MVHPIVWIFALISSGFLLLAALIRVTRAEGKIVLSDPFYITILFFFAYNVAGQFGRIPLDKFDDDIYIQVSMLVAASSFCFFLASLASKSVTQPFNLTKSYYGSQSFFYAGIVGLALGYLTWHYNYGRIGGIRHALFDTFNRIDRNDLLTSLPGNLPFTHFMFVGFMFFLTYQLLRDISIRRALFWSYLTVLPLFLFYLLEGERTAMLKYMIGSVFLVALFRYDGIITASRKTIILSFLAFSIFGTLGNLRTGVLMYIGTGETWWIEKRFEDKGVAIIMPKEFFAVNYTSNQIVSDVYEGQRSLLGGMSYLQSFPYLFPRSVHRIFEHKKQPTIADKFGEDIAFRIGRERKLGFGMSGLAESFANFHFIGPILYSFFLVFWVSVWRLLIVNSRSVLIASLMAMLTPIFMLVHRIAFASAFSFVGYVVAIALISYFVGSLIHQVIHRSKSYQIP